MIHWLIFSVVLGLVACSKSNTNLADTYHIWSVPASKVYDGGSGTDGIPPIDNPTYIDTEKAYVSDDQTIIGIKFGETVRAYPHNILNWHEIVNESLEDGITQNLTVSYCPLTGSSFLWESFQDSSDPTFGNTGFLYNSNLVMYDRETKSIWSQMLGAAINGPLREKKTTTLPILVTTWASWKKCIPILNYCQMRLASVAITTGRRTIII